MQGVLVLYHHVFLAMYALHPMWGPGGISYEGSVGKWALRLLGHGWSTSAEEEGILVRRLLQSNSHAREGT